MAKSKKNKKSKPSVKVRDLKAKKNPKGGRMGLPTLDSSALKIKETSALSHKVFSTDVFQKIK